MNMVPNRTFIFLSLFVLFSLQTFAQNKPKFAVILSGCGVYDGSEIQESVITLLSIAKAGGSYQCYAPNIMQRNVVNHLTGKISNNSNRNVLVESARIARGNINPLSELDVNKIDAIVLPGGLGVGSNLSNYNTKQSNMSIIPVLRKKLVIAFKQKKLLGFICLSPVIAAKIFGLDNVRLTIGTNQKVANTIRDMHASNVMCATTGFVKDSIHHIYSTPGYMQPTGISSVAEGIQKMISQMVKDIRHN